MTIVKTNTEQQSVIEQVLVMGDLARLTPEQRNIYYKQVCESVGLNPLTRPFEYITLNGKLTLYARKDCTDQLRSLRGVSIRIVSREVVDGVCIVTAQATDKTGRLDESTGAVALGNLRGEALANAWMKGETKAKRRVTLSLCGLGFVDESEIDGIPNARIGEPQFAPAPTRGAERLLAQEPAPAPAPAQRPEPEAGDSDGEIIDIAEIEEVTNANGSPVWKVTTVGGAVYACLDAAIISDIADARAQDRGVRVTWQKRGNRKIILDAVGEVQ
jgi:hypothetical protein